MVEATIQDIHGLEIEARYEPVTGRIWMGGYRVWRIEWLEEEADVLVYSTDPYPGDSGEVFQVPAAQLDLLREPSARVRDVSGAGLLVYFDPANHVYLVNGRRAWRVEALEEDLDTVVLRTDPESANALELFRVPLANVQPLSRPA